MYSAARGSPTVTLRPGCSDSKRTRRAAIQPLTSQWAERRALLSRGARGMPSRKKAEPESDSKTSERVEDSAEMELALGVLTLHDIAEQRFKAVN